MKFKVNFNGLAQPNIDRAIEKGYFNINFLSTYNVSAKTLCIRDDNSKVDISINRGGNDGYHLANFTESKLIYLLTAPEVDFDEFLHRINGTYLEINKRNIGGSYEFVLALGVMKLGLVDYEL